MLALSESRLKRPAHKAKVSWVDILNALRLWKPHFDTQCEAFQEGRLFIADYSTAPQINFHCERVPAPQDSARAGG